MKIGKERNLWSVSETAIYISETDVTSAQGQPRVSAKLRFESRMTTPVVSVPTFIAVINMSELKPRV